MLDILRRIIEEVNAAQDLDQALAIIVHRVKQSMGVDVCSVYLTDYTKQEHILKATDGLNPEAVGKVALSFNQGLVGLVGKRAEPINLNNAPLHHNYVFFPGISEEHYQSFLGVPIIHHRDVLGVLVLQSQAQERFSEDAETFLITIAAQLAGAIAHAEASGDIGRNGGKKKSKDNRPIRGLPGSPGAAIGQAVVVYAQADLGAIPDRIADDPATEEEIFLTAVEKVKADVAMIAERLAETLPAEELALFDAYRMMLESGGLVRKVLDLIQQGQWAQGALRRVIDEHVKVFKAMDDPYLSERSDDIRDLGQRILAYLQQDELRKRSYPDNTILVGDDVTASMLAEVPPEQLVAVVSTRGSRSSHVAILARALGVPAVMGATDLPVGRVDQREIVVDGYSGRVFVSPDKNILSEFSRLMKEEQELTAGLDTLKEQPAETPDGVRVHLYANTGLLTDITPTKNSGAEGIGLYRTEFPFMVRERFPGEEEQRSIYRTVLEAFHPKPVVLRTLDVGGDKALPYFPIEEENPFLGWRGIRITLDHPEIFLVQLRAMMRASVGLDNLQLLLPMITNVSEVDDSLAFVHRAYEELVEEGHEISLPKVGVMIEVPSTVYQVDAIAKRVDFLSVGTNDLTQYLLAVDRNNASVAELYDALHPAVIRALLQIVKGAEKFNKPVSVCGEMAGDPAAAILLLGMGIDSLSMSVSSLPRVKWVIRNISMEQAQEILVSILEMENVSEVRAYLNQALDNYGLGGLIRVGKS
jgi:phosphotransferase system enzyme I (PtsP)